MRRNLFIVIGLWALTAMAFEITGFILASTGLMGQLARESAQTGRDAVELSGEAKYAKLSEEDGRKVTITQVFVFPMVSAMLGALAGIWARSRVVIPAGLGLAPLALFQATASDFSVAGIAWFLSYPLLGCAVAWSLQSWKSPLRVN